MELQSSSILTLLGSLKFEEQNKVLESSIIIINHCTIINAYCNYYCLINS